jgi:hypothetical protein
METKLRASKIIKISLEAFFGLIVFTVFSHLYSTLVVLLVVSIGESKIAQVIGVVLLISSYIFAAITTYKIISIFHKHFELDFGK